MCLNIEDNDKFKERLRKAGARGLIVYKLYDRVSEWGDWKGDHQEANYISTIYRSEQYKLPRYGDLIIRSNRKSKKLKLPLEKNKVFLGIHVFLNPSVPSCGYPVRVYYKDFVAVGKFGLDESAVFMKIKIEEKTVKLIRYGLKK